MCCLISYKFIALWAEKHKHSVSCPSLCVLCDLCCPVAAWWWLFSLELRCWFGRELLVFKFWPEFPGQSSPSTDARILLRALALLFSVFTFLMYLGRLRPQSGLMMTPGAPRETGTVLSTFFFLSFFTTAVEREVFLSPSQIEKLELGKFCGRAGV